MCNLIAGISVTVVGAVLVVLTSSLSFTVVPNLIESIITSEVHLENNTEQWERFESIPFGLSLNVRIFNISNPSVVLTGGVPVVSEIGPYVYRSYQSRIIEGVEGDKVMYRKKEYLEFDAEASFPLTLDDIVTVVNIPYHSILQMAETLFPALMNLLPLALGGVFGVHNSPIMTVRVGDLLFDGIPLCRDPGWFGSIACDQIRPLASNVQNIEELDDGSLEFSILRFKHDNPSSLYVASRGLDDVMNLGLISSFNGSSHLDYWVNPGTEDQGQLPSVCNMLNGTDSGIFPPFVNRDVPLYAFNTDVCRSVELRYQYDSSYKGIPVARFAANDWLLDNHQGCFCLNATRGINRDDGCLLTGAMEMFTCVGALMVLSYPHFLFADFQYRNGLIGMRPNLEEHRIFVDLEPNTGTVVRGMKRAQFNVFMRPVVATPATQPLRTTLMPLLWVEEGMDLPDDFVDMVKNRLLANLRLVDILVPVVIAVSCVLLLLGVGILVRVKTRSPVAPYQRNTQLTN